MHQRSFCFVLFAGGCLRCGDKGEGNIHGSASHQLAGGDLLARPHLITSNFSVK